MTDKAAFSFLSYPPRIPLYCLQISLPEAYHKVARKTKAASGENGPCGGFKIILVMPHRIRPRWVNGGRNIWQCLGEQAGRSPGWHHPPRVSRLGDIPRVLAGGDSAPCCDWGWAGGILHLTLGCTAAPVPHPALPVPSPQPLATWKPAPTRRSVS